jgi:hypothetical protein
LTRWPATEEPAWESAARKGFNIAVGGNLGDGVVIVAAAINAAPTRAEGWERTKVLLFKWLDTARFYLASPNPPDADNPPVINEWMCPEGHVHHVSDENFPPARGRAIAMMNARFAMDQAAYAAALESVGDDPKDMAEAVWLIFEMTSASCAVAIKGLDQAQQDVETAQVLRKYGVHVDDPDHAPGCTNDLPHSPGEACSPYR